MKFATLIAATAAADVQVDMFSHFKVKNLVKMLLTQRRDAPLTGGVAWSQCEDDFGVFQFDESSTSYSPDPMTKGVSATPNLAGVLQDTIHVENMHMHADWNGSPLYDQDFKDGSDYDSNWTQSVGWDIPGFAPSGAYHITFKGAGSYMGADGTVFCIAADLSLA